MGLLSPTQLPFLRPSPRLQTRHSHTQPRPYLPHLLDLRSGSSPVLQGQGQIPGPPPLPQGPCSTSPAVAGDNEQESAGLCLQAPGQVEGARLGAPDRVWPEHLQGSPSEGQESRPGPARRPHAPPPGRRQGPSTSFTSSTCPGRVPPRPRSDESMSTNSSSRWTDSPCKHSLAFSGFPPLPPPCPRGFWGLWVGVKY